MHLASFFSRFGGLNSLISFKFIVGLIVFFCYKEKCCGAFVGKNQQQFPPTVATPTAASLTAAAGQQTVISSSTGSNNNNNYYGSVAKDNDRKGDNHYYHHHRYSGSQSSHRRQLYLQPNEAYNKLMETKALSSVLLQELSDSATSFYNSSVASQYYSYGNALNVMLQSRKPEMKYLATSPATSSKEGIYNMKPDDLSPKCSQDFERTLEAAVEGKLWAIQMFDAWGKPETGFAAGQLNWLGDFPECLAIKSDSAVNHTTITGRYCTGVHVTQVSYNGANITALYQLGMCIPRSCNSDDAASIYDFFLKLLSHDAKFPTATCQPLPEEKEWAGLAKTVYAVYGIMMFICLSAGLYDYYIHGSAMYYKVHRLPLPADLTDNGYSRIANISVRADRLSADEQGNLTQTGEDDSELEEPKLPVAYQPASRGEELVLNIKWAWLLFSIYTNGYKLLTATHAPNTIQCIHGFRFLSLSWVILGHTMVFALQLVVNILDVFSWAQRFSFQAVINATVAVDSFFVVSAILATYLLLREFTRRQIGVKDFFKILPVLYLHRYIRLTPALAFMLLFFAHGMYNLTDGPIWPEAIVTDPNCQNNSWATLLYVNNIYQPSNECVAWSWYLSNDFQFYVVTPFLVALIYWKAWVGVSFTSLLILISCVTACLISHKYDLGTALISDTGGGGPASLLSGHWFADYYVAPWCRFQSYGVGVIYGYIIWKSEGKLGIHWVMNLFLWLVSTALAMLPVYGLYKGANSNYTFSNAEKILYNGFSRTSWAVGVGYLMLACHCGRGGWINELLSWKGFIPVSRLTYCAYLIHPVIMTIINFSVISLSKWVILNVVALFMNFLFLSYCVAFAYSLFFEVPFINMDKHLITGVFSSKRK